MAEEGGEVARVKLPVWRIVGDSYRILFGNFGTYVRLSWLPYLVMTLGLAMLELYDRNTGDFPEDAIVAPLLFSLLIIVLAIVLSFVSIPISTAWTRFVYFDQGPTRDRVSYSWQTEEFIYLRRYIVLIVLFVLLILVLLVALLILAVALSFLVDAVYEAMDAYFESEQELSTQALLTIFVPITLVAWFLVCRFFPAFPAAAINRPSRLRDSWRLAKGHTGRIFAISLIANLPNLLIWIVAEFLMPEGGLNFENVTLDVLVIRVGEAVMWWVFFTLSVTSLALVYKQLTVEAQPAPDAVAL